MTTTSSIDNAERFYGSGDWRIRTLAGLLFLACASCRLDGTSPSPPLPPPAAEDLRFKGVGTRSTATPQLFSNLLYQVQVHRNRLGTPLTISPCGPPNPTLPSCSWSFGVFDMPGSGVNTVYYGLGSLAQLETDLAALKRWAFTPAVQTGGDISSVITSLEIDAPSGVYATSGVQTAEMREFDLAWGSVPPDALQAAASDAGAHGRVITAVAFNAGRVVYLSYGWQRDWLIAYEAKTVAATFGTLARDATNLAGEGYIITALGGNVTDGYLLVGTRIRGVTTPRPLKIATDSLPSQTEPGGCLGACAAVVSLAREGYAIMGGILSAHDGTSRMFNIFIGQK